MAQTVAPIATESFSLFVDSGTKPRLEQVFSRFLSFLWCLRVIVVMLVEGLV